MSAFFCVRTIGNDPRGIEMARLLLQHQIRCNRSLFFVKSCERIHDAVTTGHEVGRAMRSACTKHFKCHSTITLKGEKLWISYSKAF